MGDLGNILDPAGFGGEDNTLGFALGYDPLGVLTGSGIAGGDSPLGEYGMLAADPLDLFGAQASANQDEINRLLQYSAQEGIAQQQRMEDEARAAFKPYYDQGVEAAGKLASLYSGNVADSGYQPSELYKYQLEQGKEGITAQQSKRGLLHSSATEERKAGLVSGLAAEDVERYAGGLLSQVQMGSGSAGAMSAAGQAASGNIAGLYSALGGGLNTSAQAYGQQRQSSFQTAGNTLSNMGAYFG